MMFPSSIQCNILIPESGSFFNHKGHPRLEEAIPKYEGKSTNKVSLIPQIFACRVEHCENCVLLLIFKSEFVLSKSPNVHASVSLFI